MSDKIDILEAEAGGLQHLPLLPLRGISVFPGMLLNFDVERPPSVAALKASTAEDRLIFLVAQRELTTECPAEDDLFRVGHHLPGEADPQDPEWRTQPPCTGGGAAAGAHGEFLSSAPHVLCRRPAPGGQTGKAPVCEDRGADSQRL